MPVELIFNAGPNDLFVIRVAGNSLGAEVLGSLKYAVENLSGSLKLIVVMGHSGCGAVQAAVDAFLSPSAYLPLATKHPLRNILDRLLVVVHASGRALIRAFGSDVIDSPGYRQALVETSVVVNAALAAYSIEQEIEARDPTGLRVVYGVYLLDAREVWTPRPSESGRTSLATAPRDLAEFIALGDATAAVRTHRVPGQFGKAIAAARVAWDEIRKFLPQERATGRFLGDSRNHPSEGWGLPGLRHLALLERIHPGC